MKKLFLLIMLTICALLSAQNAWINELHYDNTGGDVGEFLEVAIQDVGNYNLADFTVTFYNGSNNEPYSSQTMDGFTAGTTIAGISLFTFYPSSIQNGSPDGICLDYNGTVIQFISYEGSFTGSSGPADGVVSVDIGLEEGSSTEEGTSLQLGGTGTEYISFYWQDSSSETPGAINNNQVFEAGTEPIIIVTSPNGGEQWEQGSTHNITWISSNYDGNIRIELLMVNDRNREILVANTENDGVWEWQIADDFLCDDWYVISISDPVDSDPIDESNDVFSIIETAIATEVSTMSELRSGSQDGTVYRLTGEAILTYQQGFRHQKYFQDDTAGILIDDDNGVIATAYELGDAITNLTGTLSEYGNMLQFLPISDAGIIASSGNAINPEIVTLAQFNSNFEDYESELIRINGISFVVEETLENGMVYEITDGNDTSYFRTTFYDVDYIGTNTPPGPIDIQAIANSRTEGEFLTSRNLDDFLAGGLVITPMVLEFLTYEDCEGLSLTLENTSVSNIIIENMNTYGEMPSAMWEITDDISFPYTLEAGVILELTVVVQFTTREIFEDYIYIETEDDLFVVTILYNTDLNWDAEDDAINPAAMLQTNYPNPFNPITSIGYALPRNMENAELKIYNTKGQLVKSIAVSNSSNKVSWNGTDNSGKSQSSGIYLYKLNLQNSPVKKMTLMK